jgi:cytoskeletal protein CcmA (bactofilin family)
VGTLKKTLYFLNKSAFRGSTIGKDFEILTSISSGKDLSVMWKPTNQPNTPPARPAEQERPSMPTTTTSPVSETPAVPRPMSSATADQATIGKSLVIKGEVTGSESLYIDGRVEGSINLAGNRVTVGRNGVVSANINAREIVVLGKVRGNLTASDRVDIRSDGSLTGDVVAARISIEDGAFFKGGIDIRKGGQKVNGEEKEVKTATPTPEPATTAVARA